MHYRWSATKDIAQVALFGVLTLCLTASAVLAGETAKERKGQISFEVSLKAPAGAKDVRLWIPYPATDANQTISAVAVSGNYTKKALGRKTKQGTKVLFAEWKGPMTERTLTYSFKATRKESIAKRFPAREQPLQRAKFRQYLDLSPLGRTEPKIRELAEEITKGKTTILARARAVYDWVVDNMRRDPDVKGCGVCDVERLLSDKAGKCADISSVYVALARASGVPARDVYGLRMHKEKEGNISKFQHCWAEFYEPGYGWVVVDPADVLKFKLVKNPTPEQLQAVREYYFGAVDENRIAMATGEQVVLAPPQKGAPLIYFMYPYAEADGKPLNEDLFGFNIGYKIMFKEL